MLPRGNRDFATTLTPAPGAPASTTVSYSHEPDEPISEKFVQFVSLLPLFACSWAASVRVRKSSLHIFRNFGTLAAASFTRLYENLLLVESKSCPITSVLRRRGHVHHGPFTPKKSAKSFILAARFPYRPVPARMLRAFAVGAGTALAIAGRRLSQRQHRGGSRCAL